MRQRIGILLLSILALLLCAAVFAQTASLAPVVTGNARVDKLLSQMTLEEKVSLLSGGNEAPPSGLGQAGTWPGLPRLGIPSLRFTDGPPGIGVSIWSTGMTATMGLAATWSREDARKNGVVIGRDARSLGQDVVLEPFVNLARDFAFMRAYNTFGEDPFLTGQIGAAQIKGIQGEGVMAQVKHFIAYEGASEDVIIDPQTLREIYLPPFLDASEAGVSSFMCSYNKVNGLYVCDNSELQNQIYRGELGFQGFNTSDWGATHGTMNLLAGLDMEMPRGGMFNLEPGGRNSHAAMVASFLGNPKKKGSQPNPTMIAAMQGSGNPEEKASHGGVPMIMGATPALGVEDLPGYGIIKAIQDGLIKEQHVSLAVGRILNQMDKFGYLDKAPKHNVSEIDYAYNAPILQKTAEDAAVLLKNEDRVLPITNDDLGSTAFIGPTGGVLISVGITGEKASGLPDHQMGPVPAMEKITGKKLSYYPANDFNGTPIPASAFSNLVRTNRANNEAQNNSDVNFTVSNSKALPPGTSYVWKGTIKAPADGTYIIALQTRGTTGSMSVDGPGASAQSAAPGGAAPGAPTAAATSGAIPGATAAAGSSSPRSTTAALLASLPGLKGQHPISGNVTPTVDHLNNARTRIDLKAGAHEITLITNGEQYGFPVQVRLSWVTPPQAQDNYAAAIAAARQAKKAVVFAWARQTPIFGLPGDQDKLIADVAAANPNTVVVLNTTLPVEMPWIDKVKGVLEAWYPGDEGGPAIAQVLLGKANPAGRLPITWPKKISDMVAQDPTNHPERTNDGIDGKTYYSEGLFMGYRWYDQQKIEPQFPFGFGLSYTTFAYSGLRVTRAANGGLDVSFTIKNTGKVAGDDVPQVYIGAPKGLPKDGQIVQKALVQFDRITIPAGQSKTVTLKVEPRRMQYWSVADNKWKYATGSRTLYVGASSRDIKLQADTTIAAQ